MFRLIQFITCTNGTLLSINNNYNGLGLHEYSQIINYQDNQQHGKCTCWDGNGRKWFEDIYVKGMKKVEIAWHLNRQIAYVHTFHVSPPIYCDAIAWHSDGSLEYSGRFIDDHLYDEVTNKFIKHRLLSLYCKKLICQ